MLINILRQTWKNVLDLINRPVTSTSFPSWLWITFIILALAKLWLISGQTLFAIGGAGHDDRLFVNLAINILKGEWLGSYNNLTLAKGPFYPLWIATVYVLGVPLILAQHLLYITACIIFVIALKPLPIRPAMLLLIFAILLFNPMSYTDGIMTRVIREGIYPALTILIVAGTVGLLTWQDRSIKSLLFWSTSLGVTLSAFWLNREEGIWIIPLIIIIIGLAATRLYRKRPTDWIRRLFLCILPFVIWAITIAAVAGINNAYYGISTTVEFKSPDFLAAYGALSRVKHAQWQPYVPVPRETRIRIYDISPTFAELEPYLEGEPGIAWSKISNAEKRGGENDEIKGGWFMWAFRDAVAAAGYDSGQTAMEYYRRLANEINNACAEKKIESYPKRSSIIPPWHEEYFNPLVKTISRSIVYFVRFDDFNPKPSTSMGTDDSLLLFQLITNNRLSTSINNNIKGWSFSPDYPINLTVRKPDGNLANAKIKIMSSPDVYNFFLAKGEDIPNAREARFEITGDSLKECYLYIKSGSKLLECFPLDGSKKSFQKSELYINIDFFGLYEDQNISRLDNIKISLLYKMGILYKMFIPLLSCLALICYFYITLRVIGRKTDYLLWLINSALLITIFARVIMLSIIDVTSFQAINTLYLSSVYPILLMFILLVFASLVFCLKDINLKTKK